MLLSPSPTDLIAALSRALQDEQEGVKNLDVDAVRRANETKENILWLLRETPSRDRQPLYDAIDSVRTDLQQNLILMTRAREEVRRIVVERKNRQLEESGIRGNGPENAKVDDGVA